MKPEIELPPHQPPRRTSANATWEDLEDWQHRQGFSWSTGPCLWNDEEYSWGTIVRSEGRCYQCDAGYWVILDDSE